MLHDNSVADSLASMDYKWAKDDWVSPNHPTVDHSADRSTFMRGQLDTAKKEEVRKMAKFLDDYQSPEQRRLATKEKHSMEMLPQAFSSPKSDTYLPARPSLKAITPTLTHRSMSPTPTSTSMSWKKHSMRLDSLSRSLIDEKAILSQSKEVESPRTVEINLVDLEEPAAETKYQPAQINHVEDSYWKNSAQAQLPELTPSPIKRQDQFYTAKQSLDQVDIATTVDGLHITSAYAQSPSVRKANSILTHPMNQPELINLDQTSLATAGNLTRRGSDVGSELSKVDSQATSLQRAISNALQQDDRTVSTKGDLTLEETIAARFRQSLAEGHGPASPNRSVPSTQEFATQAFEQTLARDASQISMPRQRVAQDLSRSTLGELEQSRMAEMLFALERVTEECSRRGHLIDEMNVRIADSEQTDPLIQKALADAEFRSKSLEEQLLQYKRQVDEMSREMQNLQRTGIRASSPKSSIAMTSAAEGICPMQHKALSQVEDREESFVDKVQRWEEDLTEHTGQHTSIEAAVARAQELLGKEPPSLRKLSFMDKSIHNKTTEGNSQRSISRDSMTPRAPQIATSTPKPQTTGHAGLTRQTRHNDVQSQVLNNLEAARVEVEQSKQSLHSAKPSALSIRPLTADLMPDARDYHVSADQKLYNRLRMSSVDDLQQVELQNLLKNILIQLDTPFDALTTRIVELGSQTATTDNSNEALWHEALKLRAFAEKIHATLFQGDHIQGSITSTTCLRNMHLRVEKLQRALVRNR